MPSPKPYDGTSFHTWDGTRLAYRVLGNPDARETILFINGLMTTESYWIFLHQDLGADYRIITFDLRGHQNSDLPADPAHVRIEDSARDVIALMDTLHVEQAHLAAFSMGVQILFEFYHQQPDRCLSLMAFLGPFERTLYGLMGLHIPDRVWKHLVHVLADRMPRVTNTIWHGVFKIPLEVVHASARLTGSTQSTLGLMRSFYTHQQYVDIPNGLHMALAANSHSARPWLHEIRVPTLVVAGERDTFALPPATLPLKELIPNVRFHMMKGGTHTTLIEQPCEVNAVVRDFLKGLPST